MKCFLVLISWKIRLSILLLLCTLPLIIQKKVYYLLLPLDSLHSDTISFLFSFHFLPLFSQLFIRPLIVIKLVTTTKEISSKVKSIETEVRGERLPAFRLQTLWAASPEQECLLSWPLTELGEVNFFAFPRAEAGHVEDSRIQNIPLLRNRQPEGDSGGHWDSASHQKKSPMSWGLSLKNGFPQKARMELQVVRRVSDCR